MITRKEKSQPLETGNSQKNVYQHYIKQPQKVKDKPFVCNMCGQSHIIKCSKPEDDRLWCSGCGKQIGFDRNNCSCFAYIMTDSGMMDAAEREAWLADTVVELLERIKKLEADQIGGGSLG